MLKHKKQKKKTSPLIQKMISILVMISLVLMAVPSSALRVSADSEVSGYQFNVVNKEDGTAADIIGDGSKLNQDMQLKEILGPDGQSLDLEHVSYHVTQNGEYTFKVNYVSPSGEQSEDIPVTVDTLKPQKQMTIQDLRLSQAQNQNQKSAAAPFSIPMYIDGDDQQQGTCSFGGGNIEGISDQTFDGLSYKFSRAEIRILEGATMNTFHINYYDEVNGVYYYALAKEDGSPSQDFDIAYQVPEGAQVAFIYELNTASHPVILNNTKESEGFKVNLVSGIDKAEDGSLSARYHAQVKLELTYPAGYYTSAGPGGEKAVGIQFDNPLQVTSNNNYYTRTITYTFFYPDRPVTMTVVGDEETSSLTYGLYDGNGNALSGENGSCWWRKTDAAGNYKSGAPYFGSSIAQHDYDDDDIESPARGEMAVRGGTAVPVHVNGSSASPEKIATGKFNSGDKLEFEYSAYRFNLSGPYFYWPSPMLSFCYFPNGTDYSTGSPIVETFPLWDSGWKYDPGASDTPITKTYTANNGAKITLTVKKAVYEDKPIYGNPQITNLSVPNYRVHITVENMRSSFYLKTQGSGSSQGPHYFRNLENISTNSSEDSYILTSVGDDGGAGKVTANTVKMGNNFLDKLAVYNKYLPGGHGVPWAGSDATFFKFGITPKWGYTMPRIESYSDQGLVMTNQPVEAEKAANQYKQELPLGSYSWFNPNPVREDTSPFRYVLFMPVQSLQTHHEMRAIDVKAVPIEGKVTNNAEFAKVDPGNTIVNSSNFDLLTNDRIVFNPNFKAPSKAGQTFIGFTADITPKNNPLLPNYTLTLGKDIANKVYFKPGDSISLSDYFRRDAGVLLDAWNKNKTLSEPEKERLYLMMFSPELDVKINLQYREGTSTEGTLLTGHVNKYLQDMDKDELTYKQEPSDIKDVQIIGGTNIIFSSFAETFKEGNSPYTYYYNKDHTTSTGSITADGQEMASVKYDKGLTVTYQNDNKKPFKDLSDPTVYKSYSGSNTAKIKFPTVAQSPLGKAFDYWTVEELNDDGSWTPKNGAEIHEGDPPYVFASGTDPNKNHKSIRLTAVWKDILPEAYISIPKNIVLTEEHTNLNPGKEYAGTKATITYHSVNGSNKKINVDVLKSFELSLTTDQTQKVTVSSYDSAGNLLSVPGVSQEYARAGELGMYAPSEDIWFNTKSQDGHGTYKGTFGISSDKAEAGSNTLFYISAAASGGGG